MSRRKLWRLLRLSFKTAGADKIIGAYIIFFLVISLVLRFIEPNMDSFGDGIWYCFALATTIGFGDITVVTLPGRILSIILSIYSVAVIAIFTAVITSFFMDLGKVRANESASAFLDDLEHLTELSQEELAQLSEKVKRFRARDKRQNK